MTRQEFILRAALQAPPMPNNWAKEGFEPSESIVKMSKEHQALVDTPIQYRRSYHKSPELLEEKIEAQFEKEQAEYVNRFGQDTELHFKKQWAEKFADVMFGEPMIKT